MKNVRELTATLAPLFLAATLAAGALQAQNGGGQPISKLKVISSVVNLESHQATIELQNLSGKIITAYNLELKYLNVSGKSIADTNVGYDNLFFSPKGEPDQRQSNLIEPDHTATRSLAIGPDTASVRVTVTAVVYDDRSYDGQWQSAFPLFDVRAREADKLNQAAALMQVYPASPEAFRSTIQTARELVPGHMANLLYGELHLPLKIATSEGPLPDSVPLPDKQQWQSAAKALSDEAAFWAAQSQEVKQ